MGKSTISMAIFNSYVSLPEGNPYFRGHIDLDYPLIDGCSINYLDKPLENDLRGSHILDKAMIEVNLCVLVRSSFYASNPSVDPMIETGVSHSRESFQYTKNTRAEVDPMLKQ